MSTTPEVMSDIVATVAVNLSVDVPLPETTPLRTRVQVGYSYVEVQNVDYDNPERYFIQNANGYRHQESGYGTYDEIVGKAKGVVYQQEVKRLMSIALTNALAED